MSDAASGDTEVAPRLSEPVWHLHVVSGPNAGASVPLPDGHYRFGSCIDNDIVLADPAMAEHQAVFSISSDGASLEPAAPGLASGNEELAAGEAVRITGPCELAAGNTLIKFTPPLRPKRPRWILATAATASAVLIAALAFGFARSGAAPVGVDKAFAAARPSSAMPALPDAQAALRARLDGAGLGEAVHLAQASGAVVASGTIAPDQRAAWMAAHMWFDGEYHGVALVDQVAVNQPPAGPNFAIRAVSDGDPPYVIDAKGERYTVGAVVDGGWTIAYIGKDKVVLRKDGREVAETL